MIGKKYLKFTVGSDILLLLFLNEQLEAVEPKLKQVLAEKTTYLGAAVIEDDYNSYESQYKKFQEEKLNHD